MENSALTSSLVAPDVEAAATTLDAIANLQLQPVVNLDQGDPAMYGPYWRNMDENLSFTISGSQSMSYFSNPNSVCWFMMPKLEEEIKILHKLVGNAVVGDDHHIVVGNGSSQLIQAALFALADNLNQSEPVNVVSATPFYSCYPQIANYLRSGLFVWGGDASKYEREEAYIELVTSPNNPDGHVREAVVNLANGMVVHDLAYYWPQYTAITAPADYDIMLFTVSKCTGHAGSRIGWAVVKDSEVAKKMVKFIEINTIGVSKEAQLRAATILENIRESIHGGENSGSLMNFFTHSQVILAERWRRLREILGKNGVLQVPEFPAKYCNFNRETNQPNPAYAWVKSVQEGVDLAKILSEHKIRVRGGPSFGVGTEYVRVSMIGKEEDFDVLMGRLPLIMEKLLELKCN